MHLGQLQVGLVNAAGNYALQIGTRVTYDMKVQAGHVTVTDGVKQAVR